MRDRLIELIKKRIDNKTWTVSDLADYLLANDVIVPPCKPGELLWVICKGKDEEREVRPFSCEGTKYDIYSGKTVWLLGYFPGFPFECIGDVIFRTREEAEAKLKGEQ